MESLERVLEAVKKREDVPPLAKVDAIWRSDHEVVLTAVRANWLALEFAAEGLKGDRDIVLTA
eukprot:1738762-Amphidinium_carterae.1